MGSLLRHVGSLLFVFIPIRQVCGLPEAVVRLPQNEAAFANLSWRRCPEEEARQEVTNTLCRSDGPQDELEFHCREVWVATNTYRLEMACLPSINCTAGSWPVLKKDVGAGNVTLASVQCQPCPAGRFEPHSSVSSQYREENCRYSLQTCSPQDGKVLVRAGNSTHDTLCRCWTEGDFHARPPLAQCYSDQGFPALSGCQCRQRPGQWPLHYEPGILEPERDRQGSHGSMVYMGIIAVALLGACLLIYVVKLVYNRKAYSLQLSKDTSPEMVIVVEPPQQIELSPMLSSNGNPVRQQLAA